jgi:hypothetical protein
MIGSCGGPGGRPLLRAFEYSTAQTRNSSSAAYEIPNTNAMVLKVGIRRSEEGVEPSA